MAQPEHSPISPEVKKDTHEVERKFLIDPEKIPMKDLVISDSNLIDQGYVGIGAEKSELRIRKLVNDYTNETSHTINMKSKGGMVRSEPIDEQPLAPDLFDVLWDKSQPDIVQKTRWTLAQETPAYKIVLDFYNGKHDGLVVAEVEFYGAYGTFEEKQRESAAYIPPEWFGKEITEDSRFKNQSLAQTSNHMGDIVLRATRIFSNPEA